jgi:DNA invertase Pin-like site-specific DNA recombinase
MTNNEMRPVLALLRVSTDSQDLERQRVDIERLKRSHCLVIITTVELKGVSGTSTLTNSQVRDLLAQLKKPGIQGLAISSLDRLFRPPAYSSFGILDSFVESQRVIWSSREGLVDPATDNGFDICVSAGGRAGSELREIARRCRDGKAVKRAQGSHVSGNQSLPDGITFDKRTGWAYDETKLAKVRRGYELLFTGRYSLAAIARECGFSSSFSVNRTLRNPTWKGVRAYPATADREAFEIPLPLPPLLMPEEWNRAQALLNKRRTWSKETRDQRFLGAGLLVCACGRPYYIHCDMRRGQHDTYYCASRHPRGIGCGAAALWREVVDEAIMRIVEEYLTDAKFLAAVFRRLKETPQPDTRVEREKELAKLAARRKRWMDAYDEERITKQEFDERMDKVAAAMRAIEASMPLAAPPLPDHRAVVAGLARSLARFRTWPFTEQRTTLKRVVRGFQVVDRAIPEFTLSGAFLGELAYTNSAQRLKPRYWRRCRAPLS